MGVKGRPTLASVRLTMVPVDGSGTPRSSPAARLALAAKIGRSFLRQSFQGSLQLRARDLIEIGQSCNGHAARVRRRFEREISASLATELPLAQTQRVLRGSCNRLACDHVLSRSRFVTGFNPDLPIRIDVAECQVLALDARRRPDRCASTR